MMAFFGSIVMLCLLVVLVEGYKPGDGRDDKHDRDGDKDKGKGQYNCLTKECWSDEKTEWCCANKGLGCPATPNGKGKGKCKGKPRDIEYWRVTDNEVKLKARQITETYSDHLDFQIKVGASDGIDTKFKYYLKPDGGKEVGKFAMKMKLFKIIEFKDTSSAEGYDSGDEIIQEYVLGSPKGGKRGKRQGEMWSPITEIIDPGNPEAKSFSAKTKDGVFEVIGRYSGKPANFTKSFASGGNGSSKSNVTFDYHLMPSNIKFDYIIRDFPFMSDGSMLALEGRFKSDAQVRRHPYRKHALETPADDAIHGMFTWASTVTVDGNETSVLFSLSNTTAEEDDEEVSKSEHKEKNMKAIWTFARAGPAASFIWDPTLGLDEESENQSDDDLLSGASALSNCFLALLPLWALRFNF